MRAVSCTTQIVLKQIIICCSICVLSLVTGRVAESGLQAQSARDSSQTATRNGSDIYNVASSLNGSIDSRKYWKDTENNKKSDPIWLINITSAIKIKFTEVEIESCCYHVELYDQTQQVRNESLRYKVDKLMPITGDDELELWLRGPVVIRFTTHRVRDWFSLNYSVIADQELTLPTQVIRSRRGYLESHWGYQNYSDNTLKSWLFIQDPSRVLEISFIKFDLQSPNDFVKIFRGQAPNLSESSALCELSGNLSTIQRNELKFSGNVTLVFQSDSAVSGKGFFASFISFWQTALSSNSGTISSFKQENSSKYFKNADDRWTINVTDPVLIKFSRFKVGLLDYLNIYEKTEEPNDASLRFEINEKEDAEDSFVLPGPVVIQFKTDASINYEGFSLQYRTVDKKEFPVRTRILRNRKFGRITSNVQPSSINDGSSFSQAWKLLVEPNEMVIIKFTDCSLQTANDFVRIFIGDEAVKRNIWSDQLNLNNSTLTEAVYAASKNVTILLQSDSNENNFGFSLKYYYQNVHTSKRGNISLADYDRSSLDKNDAVWLINASGIVNLKFNKFSLEDCCQTLELYERMNGLFRRSTDRPAFRLKTKADSKFEFRLRGPVILRFMTTLSAFLSQFSLEYSVLQAGDSNLFSPVKVVNVIMPGFITDNMLECKTENQSIQRIWSLTKKPNQNLILELNEFDSLSEENLVEVYSGINANKTDIPLFKFSGNLKDIKQRNMMSSDNLTLVIKSNCRADSFIFTISYKSANMLPSKRDAKIIGKCWRNYETYATDCDERWIIDTKYIVQIEIENLDFTKCCDNLYLFDNSTSDKNGNHKFQIVYDDRSFKNDRFQLQGPVLIRYRSKGSSYSRGFQLKYSVLESENTLSKIPTRIIQVKRGRVIKSQPKIDSTFPRKRSIQWQLLVEPNEIFELKFNKFDLKLPNNSLKIFSRFSSNLKSAQPLFTMSGQLSDFNQTTFTHKGSVTLFFEFGSDDEDAGDGFVAFIDSYSLLTSSRGIIMSRTDPKTFKYYNSIDDKWIVNITQRIRIVFVQLDLESRDKVRLYENTNSISNLSKGNYISNARKKFKRIDNEKRFEVFLQAPVVVRFHTDARTAKKGFQLFYEAVPTTSSKSTSTSTGNELLRNITSSSFMQWMNL